MSLESPTLCVHCVRCGAAVTLQLSNWASAVRADGLPLSADAPELQKASWQCPECREENPGGFPGRIARTKTGHGPEGRFRFPIMDRLKSR
jgi:hypothetical protein